MEREKGVRGRERKIQKMMKTILLHNEELEVVAIILERERVSRLMSRQEAEFNQHSPNLFPFSLMIS